MKTIGAILGVLSLAAVAQSAVIEAGSAEELRSAARKAKPGDTIQLRSGEWRDEEIEVELQGTEEAPITIAASAFGDVILTGDSSLVVKGEHAVIENLVFSGVSLSTAKRIVWIRGTHCRLTRCGFFHCNPDENPRGYHWVQLNGRENRVDHCAFAGQKHEGVTLVVDLEGEGELGQHLIERNYFGPRPSARGKNGYETIRVGDSESSMRKAEVRVEHNLFEECDGEIEMISNKSCGNSYRFNTLLRCAGALTLRHGNDCLVEGNIILGGGKKETGGIRIIGEGHRIIGNWISGTEGRCEAALVLSAGEKGAPLNGHHPVRGVRIENNFVIDNRAPSLAFDHGHGEDNRTVLPEDVSFSGNLFVARKGEQVISPPGAESVTWKDDKAVGDPLGIPEADGLQWTKEQGQAPEPPAHLTRDDVGPGIDLTPWINQ